MRFVRFIVINAFGGAIQFVVTSIIAAICLVWNFAPEEWLASLFSHPPSWLFQPYVRIVVLVFGLIAIAIIIASGRYKPKSDPIAAAIDRLTEALRDKEPVALPQNAEVPKAFIERYEQLAELSLSDGEKGSWTPTIKILDENASATINYKKLIGRYWSNGDVCRTEAEIVFTPNCPDGCGAIEIGGLPFRVQSGPRVVIGAYEKVGDSHIEMAPMRLCPDGLVIENLRFEPGLTYIVSFSATYSI